MASIEEVIEKCSVEELRVAVDNNKLPSKGKKHELVSLLISNIPPKKILQCLSDKQLQLILKRNSLPINGNKNEMVKWILALTKSPKQQAARQIESLVTKETKPGTKEADYKKGIKFEERVASWAKRKFNTDFAKSDLVNGMVARRPHQVDIHVRKKKLFGQDDIWIECKNMTSSVKRTHISKLVDDAKDVYKAFDKGGEEYYYNGLLFVSTSKFDHDALRYADEYDVLCIIFDGKTYKQQNNPKYWLGQPQWLDQVMYGRE